MTKLERDIKLLVLKDYQFTVTESEIAAAMVLCPKRTELPEYTKKANKTIKFHLTNMYRKLQVSSERDFVLKLLKELGRI